MLHAGTTLKSVAFGDAKRDPYRDREGTAPGTTGGMVKRSAAMSSILPLMFALGVGLFGICGTPAQTNEGSIATATCDTTFTGRPGAPWQYHGNWSNGIPRPGSVACFPDAAAAESMILPNSVTVRITDPYRTDPNRDRQGAASVASGPRTGRLDPGAEEAERPIRGSAATGLGPGFGTDPPPVDAVGACCTGTSCVFTDWFDCRQMGGYLRVGVSCSGSACSSGVCCTDGIVCTDGDDIGQPMTQALCDIESGVYVGGAGCGDTDPCQRYRLPEGFEIVQVHGNEDRHGTPSINNCGEVALHVGPFWSPTAELFFYDNGALTQLTDNDISDSRPVINDAGTMAWNRGDDGFSAGQIVLREPGGELNVVTDGLGPHINAAGHLVWDGFLDEPPNFPGGIFLYDGAEAKLIFEDTLSNQAPKLNDKDDVTWTRYDFSGGGGFGDWVSDIALFEGGTTAFLPSNDVSPQSVDINNLTNVVWDGSPIGVEMWNGSDTQTLVTDPKVGPPTMNDAQDVTFSTVDLTFDTALDLRLYREGELFRISGWDDIEHAIANLRGIISNHKEIAWWWHPNGQNTPSGIRLMRLIRNGDTDFDGDVDLDDFIPMPGCYTGPVITDGLCECRFFDIDHDRDVDTDDFDYLMRNYVGPLEDCNGNMTPDIEELLVGTVLDCDLNGRIDACDLSDNAALDCDLNGFIDACDIAADPALDCDGNAQLDSCELANDPGLDADLDTILDVCCSPVAPAVELIDGAVSAKNRFLSFTTDASVTQAIRVTFVDLPAPFDLLNGQSMWVSDPRDVSQNGAAVDPIPGFLNFTAATLSCLPQYADWSALGTIHVFHESVVPLGVYEIQVIDELCGLTAEFNYSPALTVTNAQWGDTMGTCAGGGTTCTPPDGDAKVADVLAILAAFSSSPDAVIKPRADLEPGTLDLKINISDALAALTGFQGLPYGFPLTDPSPCGG